MHVNFVEALDGCALRSDGTVASSRLQFRKENFDNGNVAAHLDSSRAIPPLPMQHADFTQVQPTIVRSCDDLP